MLVLFSTVDGQTLRVAERVCEVLRASGHETTLLEAGTENASEAIPRHDAVVVGAAIRYGHHSHALERFVRRNAAALAARRNAFFSVCMCAGEHKGSKPDAARRYVEEFCKRTGWQPGAVASFAGALRYRAYNPFIRALIRLIMRVNGGETDASRDHEFTDWSAVERFARGFAGGLRPV